MSTFVKVLGALTGSQLADSLYCKVTGQTTHWSNGNLGRTCAQVVGMVAGYQLTGTVIRMDTVPVPIIAGGIVLTAMTHSRVTDYGQLPEVV